jgi:DNA polymerase-4
MMTESASGRTLVLKVKYADFHQITRSRTSDRPIRERDDFLPELKELLAETEVALKPFRLLGIGVTNLLSGTEVQGLLPFPECPI